MKPLTLVNAKIDSPELSAQEAAVDVRPREIPAFREIFETHAPYVWRTLRRLGVHDADAKDMCQEVFVVVHRRLPDFEATSSVKTWVYGIAIRVASQYRRRARHRSEELSADLPEVSVPPEQEIDFRRREFLGRLEQALDRLDHHKRSVFVLFELEDMTMNEVAQTLGCPLQTAYSRLHAARALVREAFVSMDAPKGDE